MPNENNLIPLNQRTKSEQREIQSSGGVASGASRRRKRSMREAAEPPADQRRWNKIARQGVAPEDIDNQMAMVIGLTERAIKGDARAAKVMIDLLGDSTKDSCGRSAGRSGIAAPFLRGTSPCPVFCQWV